jgi:hypothetical protein
MSEKQNKSKMALWLEEPLSIQTTKTLSNGTERIYYKITIPYWAIEREHINPNKEYKVIFYPIEKEQADKDSSFWLDCTLSIQATKTLKSGERKRYYKINIPAWVIDRGELKPGIKYRIEFYPLN